MKKAVFFDLDGTLANTAADLLCALNRMRAARGMTVLALETVMDVVSQGSRAMMKSHLCAAGEPVDDRLRAEFFAHYRACGHRTAHLFAGIPEVLDEIESRGLPWGIVTNKITDLTMDLLPCLGVAQRISALVCGDTLSRPKPDPGMLREACRQTGTDPAGCLFLGDDNCDLAAARACGMPFAAASWGGLWRGSAELELSDPREIIGLL